MRKSFLRFAFVFTAMAFITLSVTSCKSGPKDADLEKAINEKATAIGADATVTASVKDGVATLAGSFKDDATKSAFESTVKAIPGVKSVVDNGTVAPPPPPPVAAPVVVAGDSVLTKGVTDATKDFPGVKASVKDSVIILTGEIKKASLPKLMMTLHTLKAKKIDNQLITK
jgi:hyperosmotically inducible protein